MLANDWQLTKVDSWITSMREFNLTFESDMQSLNADTPIDSTESGIIISVSFEYILNFKII